MKKLLVFAALTGLVFADVRINPSELPAKVQDFVKNTFLGLSITAAKQDYSEYELYLSNGAELEFNKSGEWKEVKMPQGVDFKALELLITPAGALAINNSYPAQKVLKIEREWSGFELELDNDLEVFIDKKGNIISSKFDD